VAFKVDAADEVVQPVAENGAEEGADDGGEVEHSCESGISVGIFGPGRGRCDMEGSVQETWEVGEETYRDCRV